MIPEGIRRVIVLVVDGLRADAIPLYQLETFQSLAAVGAATLFGRTVTPSVTAAAMTSLLTGVTPQRHGLVSDRFGIPKRHHELITLPGWLRRHGIPTRGFMASLPLIFRRLGDRIGERLEAELTFSGQTATQILEGTLASLDRHGAGFWLCHWPDVDRIGHREGWTSLGYARAAEMADRLVAKLVLKTGVLHDPGTVLIILADHGGGGARDCDHDSDHRQDTAIPILLVGGQVVPQQLPPGTSLLDVPATVPWIFGAPLPASYQGRVLAEAFIAEQTPHRAVA